MSDPEELVVGIEKVEHAVVVRPSGDIDLSRSPELRGYLAQVQKEKPRTIIIDLDDVPYMDSSGLATLVEAMQNARKSGTTLVLCSLHDRVRSIFEIARLEQVFQIVGGVSEGLEA